MPTKPRCFRMPFALTPEKRSGKKAERKKPRNMVSETRSMEQGNRISSCRRRPGHSVNRMEAKGTSGARGQGPRATVRRARACPHVGPRRCRGCFAGWTHPGWSLRNGAPKAGSVRALAPGRVARASHVGGPREDLGRLRLPRGPIAAGGHGQARCGANRSEAHLGHAHPIRHEVRDHVRQVLRRPGPEVDKVHGDAQVALLHHLLEAAPAQVEVHAQEAAPAEEVEAAVGEAALLRQRLERALEERHVGDAGASAPGDALHGLGEEGTPLVGLGARLLTEDGRGDQGDLRAGLDEAVPDLQEGALVELQGGRGGQLAEDPVHVALHEGELRLEVVRADEHGHVRGVARDDLVEALMDVRGALHVHAGVEHGAVPEALAEHADPVRREVAAREAVAEADHGLRCGLAQRLALQIALRRLAVIAHGRYPEDREPGEESRPTDDAHQRVAHPGVVHALADAPLRGRGPDAARPRAGCRGGDQTAAGGAADESRAQACAAGQQRRGRHDLRKNPSPRAAPGTPDGPGAPGGVDRRHGGQARGWAR
mmetsp:Transcript_16427/g.49449  ORF Transcript_16427/g.49449 Transcript_16427/m.49449 type:complete len:542 (+) Transcript_16427:106-1731(+)